MKLENIVETFCNYVKQMSLFRSRLKLSLEDREVPGSSPRSLSRDRWEENSCNILTTYYYDRLNSCSSLVVANWCFLYCLSNGQLQSRRDPSISASQRGGRCSAFGKVTLFGQPANQRADNFVEPTNQSGDNSNQAAGTSWSGQGGGGGGDWESRLGQQGLTMIIFVWVSFDSFVC